ncbi:sulfur carrier protein ThiS [Enterovibrio nigricans]|uniref:Sulfur carrier protein n=1 Tax=Enterovibrio nigricans DSM 22720 TaxID=1121868 RepID=A0A1T4U9A9_9GAMM|nr:sulfur carrier protein ThiS [Enterovibrio nigricans]SKA49362.1 sulfur carrier protein [Enterovibrio nigricans DSM 22720]
MQIWLNEKAYSPSAASNILALVAELELPEKAVAIAIDGDIIPRSQWQETTLTDGIQVAVFQAIAGG